MESPFQVVFPFVHFLFDFFFFHEERMINVQQNCSFIGVQIPIIILLIILLLYVYCTHPYRYYPTQILFNLIEYLVIVICAIWYIRSYSKQ